MILNHRHELRNKTAVYVMCGTDIARIVEALMKGTLVETQRK